MASYPEPIKPDREAIVSFLAGYLRVGIQLVAIEPDTRVIEARWFDADAEADGDWALGQNIRGRGVYFSVNLVRKGLAKKAEKTDVVDGRMVHVDIDPQPGVPFDMQAVLGRLDTLQTPPSFVIASGGGVGAFWVLEEPSLKLDMVEAINMQVRHFFDADACHNIDRVMRLPGTVNFPNKKKAAAGRVPAMAHIIRSDDGVTYRSDILAASFPAVTKAEPRSSAAVNIRPFALITADDLGLEEYSPLRSLIDHPRGDDRSSDAFSCAGAMQRDGYEPEQIMGILLNPNNVVSQHILAQRDPRYQAIRCIEGTALPRGEVPTSKDYETKKKPTPGPLVGATPYKWRDPETIPPRPWVYGRWLLRASTTAMIAAGGIGKSTFVAGTALALVTGSKLHGKTVWGGPMRVWIWNLEDSSDELARSIQAAAKHFGLTEEDLGERLFVDAALDGNGLCVATAIGNEVRIIEPVVNGIIAELKAREIDVLIIDPFVSCHEVDENSNTHIDKVAKAWSRIAMAANVAIILVHHTSKAGSADVTAMSGRGAVAMINACRSALVFNRMMKEEAVRLGIDEDEHWRYFSVHDDKHNRAPAEKADWFCLASVDLGNGIDAHRPSDSLGVAHAWTAPDPFEGIPTATLLRVQNLVCNGRYRAHHNSPDWFGQIVGDVLGIDVSRKPERARVQYMQRVWVENGAFKVVDGLDERRKSVKFIEVDRWANDASAPARSTGAEQTGAANPANCSTTTRPPTGRGGGAGGAGNENQPERSGWHRNPALGRDAAAPRGFSRWEKPAGAQILAPGETGREPIPGFDDDD